jgi:hypothetical protein
MFGKEEGKVTGSTLFCGYAQNEKQLSRNYTVAKF